ncbi:recombinase family protein [Bacillus sp. REN10]|uniref:recombinase family protein n=1 Tax=Bacillus sp. REN10 TaxID=2782541 RepID=UPI00193B3C78|nr:recombinase family protein [Bacillus sp. REN10]
MKKERLIVIYSRVSSSAQSLELQESAAKRYLESRKLSENDQSLIYLNDHDVSATKLPMTKRSRLMELINLIKADKVKKVIVYKRDRLARNFYEFVDITKIFIKHKIEVVYTASNEPNFSRKLALEAFYGMFSQVEGENIRTRTADARKQFPSRIYGYNRIKDQNQVKFVVDQKKKDHIEKLFTDFSKAENEEEFFELLIQNKKIIKSPEKILKLLSNCFYSGHFEMKNDYQALPHVEPVIDLKLFLAVKNRLDTFINNYHNKVHELDKKCFVTPLCSYCGQKMKRKQQDFLDIGYFVCNSDHKRLFINIEELNELVNQTIMENVRSVIPNITKRLISEGIRKENKRIVQTQKEISEKYLDKSLMLCTMNWKDKPFLQTNINEILVLKKKYQQLSTDLSNLATLEYEVKDLYRITSQLDITFSEQDFVRLTELLVDKITVHDTHVSIELFLSKFMKGMEVI